MSLTTGQADRLENERKKWADDRQLNKTKDDDYHTHTHTYIYIYIYSLRAYDTHNDLKSVELIRVKWAEKTEGKRMMNSKNNWQIVLEGKRNMKDGRKEDI